MQLDHLESIEEILAETALRHFAGKIEVGGGHHANVDLAASVHANASNLAFLQASSYALQEAVKDDVEVSDLVGKSATLRIEDRPNTAGIVVDEIVAY